MGTRDDDTPELRPPGKRRPESLWGDTQRANAGIEHRRAEAAGLDSESRRGRRSAAIPVPVGVPDSGEFDAQSTDEITSPIELLDRAPNEREMEIARRAKRDSGDPLTVLDGAKILDRLDRMIEKLRFDEKSNNTKNANQLLELLNRPPDEATQKLGERLAEIERGYKLIRIIVFLVVGAGGGSLMAIAQRIWDRAEHEGETTIRLQHVEDAVQRIDDHRYSPAAERPSWLQPPTKAPTP